MLQGVMTSSGGHKSRIAVLINKRKNWQRLKFFKMLE